MLISFYRTELLATRKCALFKIHYFHFIVVSRQKPAPATCKKLDAKIRKEKRKIDTRRKVLLGEYILNKLETTDRNAVLNDLKTNLPKFLERKQDIKLFQNILELENEN